MRNCLNFNLLTSCKLAAYLADIESQANKMYDLIVRQLSKNENITEQLKAENPMEWDV
ncbi:MAG: TnpV protein [Ruminococcus sp.]|nr:TnpV protein [Ruminococcus sp.]